MVIKRLTESRGWVNGVTHHPSPNCDGGMAVPSGVRGVVMHTMVGNLPGTDAWFHNPDARASAHFGIAQDGTIIQWVSIRGGIAWHCMNGNANWYGIEHADNGNPSNPLTDAQINASAQLVELLSRDSVGRFALRVSNSTTTEGYGVHYMGGAAWGSHPCPQNGNGSGPRAAQRAEIIRRAKIIRSAGQYPAPSSTAEPPKPIARLTVIPASGAAPLAVTADLSASNPGSGHFDDLQVGWGDMTGWLHGTSARRTHTYQKPGLYDITLIGQSSNGRQDTAHAAVTVTAAPPSQYTSDGTLTLAEISAHLGRVPSSLLRRTAIHYGAYDAVLSAFLNAAVAALPDLVPAGAQFWKD
jgi:N-acetylmuramoyl-L-alanine amidase/PKD domain